ncbi:MAG TPA: hypothetical protein VF181_12855 [Balneolaceae bacterium]
MEYLGKNVGKKAVRAFFLCLFLFAAQAKAQVSIAPTSLFFTEQSRFSSLTVSNGGDTPQEISISMKFGYPTTQNGNLVIASDSVLAQKKSMASWIKVFPRSFTLQPHQRQVVRFVARAPQGLKDGGYWSRVKITSSAVSAPIGTVGANQVGAQINLIVNQVISAHYRTGKAATDVEVTSIDFTQKDNTGSVAVSMKQTGNTPFIGSIGFVITNENGDKVYQTNTTNSVYTTITRNFNIDLSKIESGKYTISGMIISQRNDISQDKLLQIKPVSFQKEITIK